MAEAPLLQSVPSLTGCEGSPSMFITWPFCVETTWPQPTPQNGHTVVEAVAPRVLSTGTGGPQPAGGGAPAATAPPVTAPVVRRPRNWRRVGCVDSVDSLGADSAPGSGLTPSLICAGTPPARVGRK